MMPEVMAYTAPGQINSYVTDADIGKAQQGFLYGFLLMITNHGLEATLDDVPDFARYVRALADLRARTAHCTTEAEFADADGLVCEGGQAKRFVRADGRSAVVLINPSDAPAWAQVQVDGARAGAGLVHRLDGTTSSGGRLLNGQATLALRLDPRNVVVWEIDQVVP